MKVTRTMLDSLVARVYYINGREAATDMFANYNNPIPPADSRIGLITIALVELKTGFVVTGQSACINPKNYNAEEGRKLALEDAIGKLWDLHGYHLMATQPPRTEHYSRNLSRVPDAVLNQMAMDDDTDASIEQDIRRELARD